MIHQARLLFGNLFVVTGMVALTIGVSFTSVWQPPYYLDLLGTAAMAMVAVVAFVLPNAMTILFCLLVITLRHDVAATGGIETGSLAKLAFLGLLACHAAHQGVRPIRNWTLIALSLMLIITFTLSSHFPLLTMYQTVKSAAAIATLFLPLHVKWSKQQALFFLRLFTWLPALCIALGCLLWVLGGESIFFFEVGGAVRLQGALIAPFLAMLGMVAIVCGLYFVSVRGSKGDVWLALLNLAIVVFTGTRMAMLSSALAIGLIILFGESTKENREARRMLIRIAVPGAIFISIIYMPQFLLRQDDDDRSWIWTHFYAIYEVNRAFGRGIGSASVAAFYDAGVLPDYVFDLLAGIRAAHNVYLQLMVDTGIVGMTIFVISVLALYFELARRVCPPVRQIIKIWFIALAVDSFTDNTISGTQFIFYYLSLALMFSLGKEEPRPGPQLSQILPRARTMGGRARPLRPGRDVATVPLSSALGRGGLTQRL